MSGEYSVPNLPGYSVPQKRSFFREKGFEMVNGIRVEKKTVPERAIREGVPHNLLPGSPLGIKGNTESMQQDHRSLLPSKDLSENGNYSLIRQQWDREKYDDPKNPATKPLPYQGGKPIVGTVPFLQNCKVFKFHGYYVETVPESPKEDIRVRKVDLIYYSEDETVHVEEPLEENSGIPQGKYLRRHRLPNQDGTGYYTLKDLRVGTNIILYSKLVRIADCDEPTRNNLKLMGLEQPEAEAFATGSYDRHSERMKLDRGGNPDANYGKKCTSMKFFIEAALGQNINQIKNAGGFIKHGGKILSFQIVWDTRGTEFGALNRYNLVYYLANKTIQIQEMAQANSGKDPFPKLLGRSKLPKKHVGEIYNDKDRGVETGNPSGHYYEEEDLRIGNELNVWGRKMLIVSCDSATQNYYRENHGIVDFTPIEVLEDSKPVYERIPPPHLTGIGSEEDSLASWRNLHPKKPKRNLKQMAEWDGKLLQFSAKAISGVSVPDRRNMCVKFYLADDTIGVFDRPERNSGIEPGCYLRRAKFRHPTENRYYTASDFREGARIILANKEFELLESDQYTRDYINDSLKITPIGDIDVLMDTMKAKLFLKNKGLGFLRKAFRQVDDKRDQVITFDELRKYFNLYFTGDGVSDEDIKDIFKKLDANEDGVIDYNEFCDAISNEERLAGPAKRNAEESSAPKNVLHRLAEAYMKNSGSIEETFHSGTEEAGVVNHENLYNILNNINDRNSLQLKQHEIRSVVSYLFPQRTGTTTVADVLSLLANIQ